MRILLDTNVLARLIQQSHPQHGIARNAVRAARSRDDELCIVPQVLYELWVVCTRSVDANGLGLDVAAARSESVGVRRFTVLLRDERAIFQQWEQLVAAYRVCGKAAHDARLVAAMLRHGLTHILTFNADDFRRYGEIAVLTPEAIIGDAATR